MVKKINRYGDGSFIFDSHTRVDLVVCKKYFQNNTKANDLAALITASIHF